MIDKLIDVFTCIAFGGALVFCVCMMITFILIAIRIT